MEQMKKYFAFISYKREDEEWAKWLQHKLEHYKLPSNLNGRSDLPKEIRPIFRDKSDLAGGVLAEEINDALENSQYLIVICSPHAAHSEWVSKEVKAFIDMGRSDKIIPFIIGGTAHAQNPEEECFPVTLREMPADQELLGVNINEMGRDAAAVKVVAQMFGLKFDELWQRWEREQKRRRNWIVAASVIGFLLMAGVAGWIWWQYREIKEKDWKMMENQSRFVAEKAMTIAKDDSYLARILALDALPNNVEYPNRPYTSEAEALLRAASLHNSVILERNNARINSAVFSPDGKHVLSISDSVVLWDAENGARIRALSEDIDIGYPTSVTFSSDGEQILISSYVIGLGSDLNFFDMNLERMNLTARSGWTSYINDAVISPNGKFVAWASSYEVMLWDVELEKEIDTGQFVVTDWGYMNGLQILDNRGAQSIAFSPNSKLIALAIDDNTIRILDVETKNEVQKLSGHTERIQSVDFCPNKNLIASGSWDGSIKIWDVERGIELLTLKGHTNHVNSVSYSSDGKLVVSASDDRTVRIWDTETGDELRVLQGHKGEVYSASFSHDCKRIVSASEDGTTRIWEVMVDPQIQLLKGHTGSINSVDVSLDGQLIASASSDSTIRIWNAETGTIMRIMEGHKDKVAFVSFSSDCKHIVSASEDGTTRIWDVDNGFERMFDTIDARFPAVFSLDGTSVLQVGYGGTIRIWDVESGDELKTMHTDGYCNTSAAFSFDRKRVAFVENTRLDSSYTYIVDMEYGNLCQDFQEERGINTAGFSPDGKMMVSTSYDHSLRIWDVEKGSLIRTITGHNSYVIFAVFSPNGKYIVSGSDDKTIRVWDAETGDELQMMEGDNDRLECIAFTPDSRSIIVGSSNGTIRIWPFPPLQELIDKTRKRFKYRPLTPEERRMYYLE